MFAIVYVYCIVGNCLCWSKVGEQHRVQPSEIMYVCRIPTGHDNRSSTPHHITKLQSTNAENRKNNMLYEYKTRISFKCDFQTSCFCGFCYNFHLFHYAIRSLQAYCICSVRKHVLGGGVQLDITKQNSIQFSVAYVPHTLRTAVLMCS